MAGVSVFEERAEIGVRSDALRLDELDRALEQRLFGEITADECQRGKLLQRAR